jgi:adenylate cyclase
MIFSLQRRFLLLLLLPVTIILLLVGGAGFFFAGDFFFDQWVGSTQLKLGKAAKEIQTKLEDKLELINLMDKAHVIPRGDITQAFLIQQLIETKGVRFVEIEVSDPAVKAGEGSDGLDSGFGNDVTEGVYTMELCGDVGFCAPLMDPDALDRSLRIVKSFHGSGANPTKRLIVRISFASFLKPIQNMGLLGDSQAFLVTRSGQLLAHTDPSKSERTMLGKRGDPLEKKLLKEIQRKAFGTIFSKGYPPKVVMGFYRVAPINWYLVVVSKGETILGPLVTFWKYYFVAGVLSLLAILLLIRLATRGVAQSIGEISSAAARVQTEDYSVRLPEDRSDEIGQLNKSFNTMMDGLKQRDLIRDTFGRYVDNTVAEELMRSPDSLRLGGEQATVTIMMTDIRNFTDISEKLHPEKIIHMLNRYFARMIAVIERYRGIIVDFYGDGILIFFNGVDADTAGRAADALNCALDMQREMSGYNEENEKENLPPLGMGVGIHTGEVVVGNIGTETRAKYGIVGSNVNLTSRIQSTASSGRVVISEETYALLAERMDVARSFSVCLKGVEGVKSLYEIDGAGETCLFYPDQ